MPSPPTTTAAPVKRKAPGGSSKDATSSDVPALTVVVRIRPPNQRELDLAKTDPAQIGFFSISEDNTGLTLEPNNKNALWQTLDHVFDTEANQEQLFTQTSIPIIDAALKGYNATILAYGQTSSGKTYSLTGPSSAFLNPAERDQQGIVPRALNLLFERLEALKDTKYTVQCSYLEIYNEKCRDLLYKPGTVVQTIQNSNKTVDPNNLTILSQSQDGIPVQGLTICPVETKLHALKTMEEGFSRRQTAATKMNAQSSRSHGIFTVYIATSTINSGICTESKRKIHFVDLAGSESVGKTGATGETQKEGANINKSLIALGNVIRALAQNERTKSNLMPPFRDSNLTRVLQDSFGCGNPLCLIATLSPSRDNIGESKSTLSFAAEARSLPRQIHKPKAKVIRSNGENGKLGDEIASPKRMSELQTLVNRFGSESQLESMLEQAYQVAVLWKRQRLLIGNGPDDLG